MVQRVFIVFACSAFLCAATIAQDSLHIGAVENTYRLAAENTSVKGIAFDEKAKNSSRLFILDESGAIFVYRVHGNAEKKTGGAELLEVLSIPKGAVKKPPAHPRGLAVTKEKDARIFYLLNQEGSIPQLWRCDFASGTFTVIDLSLYQYRIGDREVFDLAASGDMIYICFDVSGYTNANLRVTRGIASYRWNAAGKKLTFVKHMPDGGEKPSYGAACMNLEGAAYLWATSGMDHIYCADAQTGRGLFYFPRPGKATDESACHGLCFGAGSVWVPENAPGPDRVYRVNVTKNPDACIQGPRMLRHLVMTISTEPEDAMKGKKAGKVYHYYSRPYAHTQLQNQGAWPETEKVVDLSNVPQAKVKHFTYDPAGDAESRQHMSVVEYADRPAQKYSSRYEIDIWTNSYRKFVYPHRVDKNFDQLAGTNYLEDDATLFNLNDTETYDNFFKRVRRYIRRKYLVPVDMDNQYWAARNVLEYIQDHYYYPVRAKRKPAAVDYDAGHYDANPGNLKIKLSEKRYNKTQIIACSGTSVMIAGAMRYLKLPARWLGTGTEHGYETWDNNGNRLLDPGETAYCSNGHRYTQVWLGSHYGWICFDGTPSRPLHNDFDPPPPMRTQMRYMERAAGGHRKDKRIVFNVGSKLFRPLYRDFEYDERLAIDNNCGGDQRYNLQGRFEKSELWKLSHARIMVKSLCFVTDIKTSGPPENMTVTWDLEGKWELDPKAELEVFLKPGGAAASEEVLLATCRYDKREATVDISKYKVQKYRIMIRKAGDPETGGESKLFSIEKETAEKTEPAEFDFEEATKDVPKPRDVWPHVKKHMIPPEFTIQSDTIIQSWTDPRKKLRKVCAHFYSQKLAGKKWGHPCVILLPAESGNNRKAKALEKVVIVGSPGHNYFPVHVEKYGEPIAARTGHPTMVLSNPGEYPDGSSVERDIRILYKLNEETGTNYYSMNCQLAVVYIRAIEMFQKYLGCREIKAVIGGHSKRGRSATVAAAIDPRVASVIIMGNEGVYRTDRVQWHLSFHHAFFQDQVHVPVFYLGATNEDGYKMFNVNIMQERLKNPMTIELIPNYCHSNFSDIQYMDFMMWASHIFDQRPVTRISEVKHRREDNRTIFTAKIESDARVQLVRTWYVYSDDDAWRDLMWYHLLMKKKENSDYYEAVLYGKIPDAFMVEVGDIALGVPGYVSSVPHKLTDAPVIERKSRGSLPRLWGL